MAVTSAVSLAMLGRHLVKPLMVKEGSIAAGFLNAGINWAAITPTGVLNMYLIRQGELDSGINVRTPDGEDLG